MAGRYPKEFKEDVIRVARARGPGETLEQIAHDFGVHPVTLSKWLLQTDMEDGIKPGITRDQAAELRKANQGIRRLEQEKGRLHPWLPCDSD
ncbi:transposase [Nocardioides bruguierae]|uniref:Transposase n=1 Tax=Nocardioides bruguierae TaxID=2945102 RepID=A0A9X2IGZ6_9ACTN|nr:transposase [Nocardioides bruguierae]MCM0622538.1 transposase [Nocardioides bruguierae]